MEIKKYTKKPVTIEAVQWDGTPESAAPIINWILANGPRAARYHEEEPAVYINGVGIRPGSPAAIIIDTLEGSMSTSALDFVIRGVEDEFYPCKPVIFEKTYTEN